MRTLAKKELLIHGTSSSFIPSILKKGMEINPKESFNDGQYSGSYWAGTIDHAAFYAVTTSMNTESDPTFVFARIETKSHDTVIDEEALDSMLGSPRGYNKMEASPENEKKIDKEVEKIITNLSNKIKNIPRLRFESQKDKIKKYIEDPSHQNREVLINALSELHGTTEAVRVKKNVGYKGAYRIVYLASVAKDNSIKAHYGNDAEAVSLMSKHGASAVKEAKEEFYPEEVENDDAEASFFVSFRKLGILLSHISRRL